MVVCVFGLCVLVLWATASYVAVQLNVFVVSNQTEDSLFELPLTESDHLWRLPSDSAFNCAQYFVLFIYDYIKKSVKREMRRFSQLKRALTPDNKLGCSEISNSGFRFFCNLYFLEFDISG